MYYFNGSDQFGKKKYFLFSKQFCRNTVRHTDVVRRYIPLKVMFGLIYYYGFFALVPVQRN